MYASRYRANGSSVNVSNTRAWCEWPARGSRDICDVSHLMEGDDERVWGGYFYFEGTGVQPGPCLSYLA